jgi:hypothetical protein
MEEYQKGIAQVDLWFLEGIKQANLDWKGGHNINLPAICPYTVSVAAMWWIRGYNSERTQIELSLLKENKPRIELC